MFYRGYRHVLLSFSINHSILGKTSYIEAEIAQNGKKKIILIEVQNQNDDPELGSRVAVTGTHQTLLRGVKNERNLAMRLLCPNEEDCQQIRESNGLVARIWEFTSTKPKWLDDFGIGARQWIKESV